MWCAAAELRTHQPHCYSNINFDFFRNGEVKAKKKGEMASKVSSNFSDLIQRVAASCLLHPLAAGRPEAGKEGYEYETDECEELTEEEGEVEENEGKVNGWGNNVKSEMLVPMERVMEMEMLMSEVFDSVSAMKRGYVSLQEAHCPWDPERMRVADVAVVGELRRLTFLRERFRRCVSIGGGGGGRERGVGGGVGLLREVVAPYEAAVEELKKEVKVREVEVETLKEKLRSVTSLSSNGSGKKGRSHSKRKVACSLDAQGTFFASAQSTITFHLFFRLWIIIRNAFKHTSLSSNRDYGVIFLILCI